MKQTTNSIDGLMDTVQFGRGETIEYIPQPGIEIMKTVVEINKQILEINKDIIESIKLFGAPKFVYKKES